MALSEQQKEAIQTLCNNCNMKISDMARALSSAQALLEIDTSIDDAVDGTTADGNSVCLSLLQSHKSVMVAAANELITLLS